MTVNKQRRCSVCGGEIFERRPVLWQALIDEWQLSPPEANDIDRQQGEYCTACGANLRSIALADALLATFATSQTLSGFCLSPDAVNLKVLELNEAGNLHGILSQMPGHCFGAYPEVDMHALPYADGTFNVVVHSDVLEHVLNPVPALIECCRVLCAGGTLCFTVPIIVGRLSRSREALPKSYHGNPTETRDDYLVQTEFGADAWTYAMQAGFQDVRLFSVEYPVAIAIAARKNPN